MRKIVLTINNGDKVMGPAAPCLRGVLAATLLGALMVPQAQAAIALDRTRVVFDGGQKSVSLSISNQNKQLPYLAQAWLDG